MVYDGLSVRVEDIRVGFIGPRRNSLIRAVVIQSMIQCVALERGNAKKVATSFRGSLDVMEAYEAYEMACIS
jgi:hypothetical protein